MMDRSATCLHCPRLLDTKHCGSNNISIYTVRLSCRIWSVVFVITRATRLKAGVHKTKKPPTYAIQEPSYNLFFVHETIYMKWHVFGNLLFCHWADMKKTANTPYHFLYENCLLTTRDPLYTLHIDIDMSIFRLA